MNPYRIALSLLTILTIARASAGAPGNPYWSLTSSECVARITIEEILSEGPTTNLHPPKLRVSITEVIRGVRPAQTTVIWQPPFHGIDWGDHTTPALLAWNKGSFPPPKIGSQWIACLEVVEKEVWINLRFPWSEKQRDWVLDYLRQDKIFRAEALATTRLWPHSFKHHVPFLTSNKKEEEILRLGKGYQKESASRVVQLGEPIVGRPVATQKWVGHVVKIEEKTIHLRPYQYDSRMDRIIARDKIELYPKWWLVEPAPLRGRPIEKKIAELIREAQVVVVTKTSVAGMFEIKEVLKGVIPPDLAFTLNPVPWDVSGLVDPIHQSYLLLLKNPGENAKGQPSYDVVGNGRAIFEAHEALLKAAKEAAREER